MKVGSLFSGIGGFDLGLERAGMQIEWQVEIDEYCRRVLAKHWPGAKVYGDITQIDWSAVEPIEILCGGFPCQDLSKCAGKREGIDGNRSGLWSEYIRAIRALRPRFILVENVPSLLTNPDMGRVLRDLAESGYDAEWDCIPAAAVGAPHLRDRIWIVAYPAGRFVGRIFNSFTTEGTRGRHELFGELSRLPWREAMARIHRMDDGVSNRSQRNRALGNALIPQIAEALGRMILEADRCRSDF